MTIPCPIAGAAVCGCRRSTVSASTPEELGRITREGLARVSKVIKDADIKAD